MIINTNLVHDAISGDYLSELAVFLKLKSSFINSCIYRPTHRKLSEVSGVSVSKLKKCIPLFRIRGWTTVHAGNMMLAKVKDIDPIKSKRLVDVRIEKTDGYRDIVKKLRLALIQAKYEGFSYLKKVCCDSNKEGRTSGKRRALIRKYGVLCENSRFSISNRSVGQQVRRSKATGSRLISWGKAAGLLRKERNLQRCTQVAIELTDLEQRQGFFIGNHAVMRQRPNFIDFLQ